MTNIGILARACMDSVIGEGRRTDEVVERDADEAACLRSPVQALFLPVAL